MGGMEKWVYLAWKRVWWAVHVPKNGNITKKGKSYVCAQKMGAELVHGQLSASAVPTTSVVSWVSCAVRNIAVTRLKGSLWGSNGAQLGH